VFEKGDSEKISKACKESMRPELNSIWGSLNNLKIAMDNVNIKLSNMDAQILNLYKDLHRHLMKSNQQSKEGQSRDRWIPADRIRGLRMPDYYESTIEYIGENMKKAVEEKSEKKESSEISGLEKMLTYLSPLISAYIVNNQHKSIYKVADDGSISLEPGTTFECPGDALIASVIIRQVNNPDYSPLVNMLLQQQYHNNVRQQKHESSPVQETPVSDIPIKQETSVQEEKMAGMGGGAEVKQ